MKQYSFFLIFFLSASFCLGVPQSQSSSFFKEQVIPAVRVTAQVTGAVLSTTVRVIGFAFSLVGKVLMTATEKPNELEKTKKELSVLQKEHARTQKQLEEERAQRKLELQRQ